MDGIRAPNKTKIWVEGSTSRLLALPPFSRYFPPAVAKAYIVSFRSHDDDRPSKFIVLADNMKSTIKMAWEHGGADFQSRFDKSTAQAEEMKEGRCGCCEPCGTPLLELGTFVGA